MKKWKKVMQRTEKVALIFEQVPMYSLYLGAIHKCQHFHESTNHRLSETPPPPEKEYTSTFLSAKNSDKNNKNHVKMLKVFGKYVDFHRPPPLPLESVWFVHPWKYWHFWMAL